MHQSVTDAKNPGVEYIQKPHNIKPFLYIYPIHTSLKIITFSYPSLPRISHLFSSNQTSYTSLIKPLNFTRSQLRQNPTIELIKALFLSLFLKINKHFTHKNTSNP